MSGEAHRIRDVGAVSEPTIPIGGVVDGGGIGTAGGLVVEDKSDAVGE
jgi:hypothetical protein